MGEYIMKKKTIAILLIGIIAGMVIGITATSTLANPGFTWIDLRTPKEGETVNKNAPLIIVTERLDEVTGIGPAKITILIETTGPIPETVAAGIVNVNLAD